MDENTKIWIDEIIKTMKNNKKLIEYYEYNNNMFRDINNIIMLSTFTNSPYTIIDSSNLNIVKNKLNEVDLKKKTNKMEDIAIQTLNDLMDKVNNTIDIVIIISFILEDILDTNSEIKEIIEYFNNKLSEEKSKKSEDESKKIDETTKILIEATIHEMKNNKKTKKHYNHNNKIFRMFNNILIFSLFMPRYKKDIDNIQTQFTDIAMQTFQDLINKDEDIIDIFVILFFVVGSILDTNPKLKEMSDYFDKKLKEEGLI
ncbi:MAG: hypothetical protein QW745_09495 [Thermoplasmata archaeon]